MDPRKRHTHNNVTAERGVPATPRVIVPYTHEMTASKTHPALVNKYLAFSYISVVATVSANVPPCCTI